MDERRAPWIAYLILCFAGSIAISIVVGVSGGHESDVAELAFLAMIVPALAVLAVRIAAKARVLDAGWRRFPLRYLPIALLLLPALGHLVILPALVAITGGLPWAAWLTPGPDGLYHVPEDRGWGDVDAGGLAIRIAINAITGVLIVSVLAFFEEIGWRAWMLPRLVARHGARKAVIASALIWASWHMPYGLSGIHHVEGMSPALTAVLMPLAIVGPGLVLGWLWERTRSIWMVTLAHGALNNWGQYALKYMDVEGHDALLLLLYSIASIALGLVLVRTLPGAEKFADLGVAPRKQIRG